MADKKCWMGMLVILLVFVIACSGNNSSKSIDDLLAFFESSGITVSHRSGFWFHMAGAIDGCRSKLDGVSVEIYKYDPTDKGGKTVLENARKNGIFSFLQVPCLINGSFIIVPSDASQEQNNEINSVFQKF